MVGEEYQPRECLEERTIVSLTPLYRSFVPALAGDRVFCAVCLR